MVKIKETYSAHSKALDKNGNPVSAEIHYLVFGVPDEDTALQEVYAYVPKSIKGMELDRVEIDDRADDTTFKVNVTYEKNSSSATSDDEKDEEPTVSFDCGGGTRQVTTAIQQIRIYSKRHADKGLNKIETNPNRTDAGLDVNWNGKTGTDSEVKGVSVPTAKLRETYTKIMRPSKLTTSFKRKVANLTGCVNKTAWKGWEKGEVMFMGCSYTAPASGSDKVTVTFNFEIQTNDKNYALPNGQRYPNKRGFDYVWAVTNSVVEEDYKYPRNQIKEIYVAQVCKYRDFSELGL